jgi:hypothetical protein
MALRLKRKAKKYLLFCLIQANNAKVLFPDRTSFHINNT